MARNGSGTYSLPEPAFVPNTPISSAAVNSDLGDIANALTNSIAADGQTTITAALKLDNAGVVYGSDPNTGIRRTAADTQAIFAGGTDTVVVTSTGIDVTGTITKNGSSIDFPAGITAHTAAATAPAGWLIRDGSAVSRTTYAALFSAIGTTYGSGDGSTTFNLPDARGRIDAGLDGGTGRLPGFTALGSTGGSVARQLVRSNLPNVAPTFTGIIDTVTVTSTTGTVCQAFALGAQALNQVNVPSFQGPITSTGTFTPSGSVQSLNGGVAQTNFDVIQPTLGLTPIIKT